VDVLHDERVDVIAEVDQVEEAVGGDLVPDGVTLVVLAVFLTRIHVYRFVYVFISLMESSDGIGYAIYILDEKTTYHDYWMRSETWYRQELFLEGESKEHFDR